MAGTYGLTSPRQFAYYSHDSSSWKTWPDIGLWGSIPYSQTWPKHGVMTCDGAVYELQMSERHTDANDCSFLLPTPSAADGEGTREYGRNGTQINLKGIARILAGDLSGFPDCKELSALLPTPRSSDCFGAGKHGNGGMDLRTAASLNPSGKDNSWGKYRDAIVRWEKFTRPAPDMSKPNKNGKPSLSAEFSEWMMGWPEKWVTDPLIGVSKSNQLRIIGNGVCPQQAVVALTLLAGIEIV